jgi:hypothetical protein
VQILGPDVETLSLHDQVVHLIGQRWTNSVRCNIDTTPGSETTGWPRSTRSAPDIVGWAQNTRRNTPLWIAEVETEDTIIEEKARDQWQDFSAMGVPLILIVPRGYKALARFYAMRTDVSIAGIYEYALSENELELT